MFIDIHSHVCRVPICPSPYNFKIQSIQTAQQLVERQTALGIDRSAILPFCSPEAVPSVQSNEDMLDVAREFPGHFLPFCNIDPRAAYNSPYTPLGDIIKYYRDKGCYGVGEVSANLGMLDPRVQNLFKGAEEAGVPLTFHLAPKEGGLYGLIDDRGLPALELCLQRFPKLKFLGHSQTFWCEICVPHSYDDRYGYPTGPVNEEGAVPRLMRKYENLLGDLSADSGCNALSRDRDYAVRFINEFQDRLFFGTDLCTPGTNTPRLIGFLQELLADNLITETVFQKLARENAMRLFGI